MGVRYLNLIFVQRVTMVTFRDTYLHTLLTFFLYVTVLSVKYFRILSVFRFICSLCIFIKDFHYVFINRIIFTLARIKNSMIHVSHKILRVHYSYTYFIMAYVEGVLHCIKQEKRELKRKS